MILHCQHMHKMELGKKYEKNPTKYWDPEWKQLLDFYKIGKKNCQSFNVQLIGLKGQLDFLSLWKVRIVRSAFIFIIHLRFILCKRSYK